MSHTSIFSIREDILPKGTKSKNGHLHTVSHGYYSSVYFYICFKQHQGSNYHIFKFREENCLSSEKKQIHNRYLYFLLFQLLFWPDALFMFTIFANCISLFLDLWPLFSIGWQTLQCGCCLTSYSSAANNSLEFHQSLQCSQCFPCLFHSHSKDHFQLPYSGYLNNV